MARITSGPESSAGDAFAAEPVRAPRLKALSYVSSLLAERLAETEQLVRAERHAVLGALMLTDIEGWTSRVEQLSDRGPQSLDELGRAANAYFIELTRIVYGHGGDVLGSVGDAFLCCWRARDATALPAACARAARAATSFQEAASQHVDPSGRRLRTRIGISAGEVVVAIIGGVNGRWELLPLGAPRRGGRCCREARAGRWHRSRGLGVEPSRRRGGGRFAR